MFKKLITILISMVLVLSLGSMVSAQETFTIGYQVQDLGNQYWITLADGVKDKAAEMDNVEVTVRDARTDPAVELSNVQDLITQGIDLLLLSPWDSNSGATVVEEANKAGIPVIVLDIGVSSGDIESFLVSNNYGGGQKAGEYMAELLEGEGQVGHIQCQPGYELLDARGNGFVDVVTEEGIEVVATQPGDSQRSKGMTVMQNMATANPDIDGVFCENDEMALGALEALNSSRMLDQVEVIGFDGTDEAIQAVKEGRMTATVAQQPYKMGQMGVELAVEVLNGNDIENEIQVPVQLITKENVDEFIE